MGATAQSDAGGNETGGMCDVQHELVRRAPARHRRRRCDALPAPPVHRAAAPAPTQVGFLQSCGFSRLALCWLQICYQSACVRSFSKREMYVLVTPNQRFPASLTHSSSSSAGIAVPAAAAAQAKERQGMPANLLQGGSVVQGGVVCVHVRVLCRRHRQQLLLTGGRQEDAAICQHLPAQDWHNRN